MRGTYITASIIALFLVVWLLSGQVGKEPAAEHPSLAEANRLRDAEAQDAAPARVRARVVHAVPQTRQVVLRGRTENKRTVEVKAETAGRVVERPVQRGSRVEEGALLCRIAIEDRQEQLAEAQAALEQARIEHEGSQRLKLQGFQSETAIAQAKARLAAAEAALASRQLDIDRTSVRAPFTGVVEDVTLEVGDYASSGGTCVTLVEMDPMLLVARVSQQEVAKLEAGRTATGRLIGGRTVTGELTFIGQQADAGTRTYAIEVEVDNADHSLRSGITTQIHIPVDEVLAHKISPALFALDDQGQIGVRTIGDDRRVQYHHVEIVRDDIDGVWVTGLPEVATLITVGQEYVVEGQRVEPAFESTGELPARAGDADQPARGSATGRSGSGRAEPPVAVVAKP